MSIKNFLQYYMASMVDASRGRRIDFLGEEAIPKKSFHFTSFSQADMQLIWNKLKYEPYFFKLDGVYITDMDSFDAIYLQDKKAEVTKLERGDWQAAQAGMVKFFRIELAPVFILPEKAPDDLILEEEIHYPYWVPVYLREDGQLFPPREEEYPIFLREYLAPNPKDSPTIAELERLNTEGMNYRFIRDNWIDYWEDCQAFFTKITDLKYIDFQSITEENPLLYFRICRYRDSVVTRHVLSLYSYLLKKKESTFRGGLLEKILDTQAVKTVEEEDLTEILLPKNHYGYMGSEFPLSASQRIAFGKYQDNRYNDIFAINGPPGTGKTMILQAFIANIFVNAVLQNQKTPLIIGCSTNNQAITNILDSMQQDKEPIHTIQQHWVPLVRSFGLYLTAKQDIGDYQYTKSFHDGFCYGLLNDKNIQKFEKTFLHKFFDYIKEERLKIAHPENYDITKAKIFLRKQIDLYKEKIDTYTRIAKQTNDNSDPKYSKLINEWNEKYKDVLKNLYDRTDEEYQNLSIIEDMAVRLDISLRNTLFWLCVHYREAEFVEEMLCREEISYTEIEWIREVAKLTPLFVSTFYSLPRYFSYTLMGAEGLQYYDSIFDYMIVDEAGQVSPEVAMPSLALAQKALLVGDTYQIEPIWGVTSALDYKNLIKYEVIQDEEGFKDLQEKGYLASSGSMMQLALFKSCYTYLTYNGAIEKGVLLREHRRCLDSIIAFANEYVYQNSLILLGGQEHDKPHSLPPMGFVHVDGLCEKYLLSRRNVGEANAILYWLSHLRKELETAYGKPLHEIVAIITPYSAQKEYFELCTEDLFPEHIAQNLVIGTVHALQGAERPIILFSATNTDPSSSYFMDYGGKTNMLNVATTRAKHAFIVFANMNIFQKDRQRPSSYLAKLLYQRAVALDNCFVYEQKLLFPQAQGVVSCVDTLKGHQQLLVQCFERAKEQLLFLAPSLSIESIEEPQFGTLIAEALRRNVAVTILTDRDTDIQGGRLSPSAKEARAALQKWGVTLVVCPHLYSRGIWVDEQLLVQGTFPWLSSPSADKAYASLVLEGEEAATLIQRKKEELEIALCD